MTKPEIIAALTEAGIPHDPNAHWKTLEALLPAPAQSPESDTGEAPEPEPAPAETPAASPAKTEFIQSLVDKEPEARPSPNEVAAILESLDTPPRPEGHPSMGDKDPAVIRWDNEYGGGSKYADRLEDIEAELASK